jgi:very-short-patch-repair endonuclease
MRAEIARARDLRRNMGEAEVMLWSRLRRLRDRGFRIRRQFPFRGYFLDFVCLSRRLVIEVDGFQHSDDQQAEHDAVRDRILERQGFRVIRIWAGEVRRNLSGVMDQIVLALEAAPSTRLPSFNGEGGERSETGGEARAGTPSQRLDATSPP